MANKKGIVGNTVGKVTDGVIKGADNLIDSVTGLFGSSEEKPKNKTTSKSKTKKKS